MKAGRICPSGGGAVPPSRVSPFCLLKARLSEVANVTVSESEPP